MATVTLPKVARELGVSAVEIDFEGLPQNRKEDLFRQGAAYFFSAAFSHAKAKLNADRGEGEAERQLSAEMVREAVQATLARLQDPNWAPRTREGSGEEEVSAEQRAWESALLPLFRDKAKVLKSASKKEGRAAVTVRSLLEEAPGESLEEKARAAYWRAGTHYFENVSTAGQPREKWEGSLERGFKAVQKQVAAVLNEETF